MFSLSPSCLSCVFFCPIKGYPAKNINYLKGRLLVILDIRVGREALGYSDTSDILTFDTAAHSWIDISTLSDYK